MKARRRKKAARPRWRPMATAPFNARVLVVYEDAYGLRQTVTICHRSSRDKRGEFDPNAQWFDDFGASVFPPSWWLPLPSPPKLKEPRRG